MTEFTLEEITRIQDNKSVMSFKTIALVLLFTATAFLSALAGRDLVCADEHCAEASEGLCFHTCCVPVADLPSEHGFAAPVVVRTSGWLDPAVKIGLVVSDIFRPPIA